MLNFLSILAQVESMIVPVVIGIIVLVFWGIGALSKLGHKTNAQAQAQQAEQERRVRAHWEEVRRREMLAQQQQMQQGWQGTATPPPLPPALQMPGQRQQRRSGPAVPPMRNLPQSRPLPMPPPQQQAVRRPKPAKQSKQQQKRAAQQRRVAPAPEVPEPMPGSSRRTVAPSDTPGVRESAIGEGSAPASPSRRSAQAAAAVRLSPQTLRDQFILTEILQPPLALRDQSTAPHN